MYNEAAETMSNMLTIMNNTDKQLVECMELQSNYITSNGQLCYFDE